MGSAVIQKRRKRLTLRACCLVHAVNGARRSEVPISGEFGHDLARPDEVPPSPRSRRFTGFRVTGLTPCSVKWRCGAESSSTSMGSVRSMRWFGGSACPNRLRPECELRRRLRCAASLFLPAK